MPSPAERTVYADLHTHTSRSDGRLSPRELVAAAAERGLQVLAVTDHDTVRGLDEARAAAEDEGLVFVPGIEMSATIEGAEVHVLAYGIDATDDGLQAYLRDMQAAREDRAWAMMDRLREQGVEVDDRGLHEKITATTAVGRPHVAAVLVEAGQVDTMDGAFEKYLGNGKPAYVPKPEVPVGDALDVIHGAGGVAVLAHPGHWTPGTQIRRMVDEGLDGIEIWHPSHDASLQRYYQRLARGYGLSETGGSDYHGHREGDGPTLGAVGMSVEAWERFQAATA